MKKLIPFTILFCALVLPVSVWSIKVDNNGLADHRRTGTSGSSVLLLENVLPWGSSANENILDSLGIQYDVQNSSDLATLDLTPYKVVIVPSQQPDSFYNTLTSVSSKINAYVDQGGVLEFHAAAWGLIGSDPSGVTLPGGVGIVFHYADTNYVVDFSHPIVAGVPSPFTDFHASHCYFSNLAANTRVIVVDDTSNPDLIEYTCGWGRVIASGVTLEWGYKDGQPAGLILRNLIPYSLSVAGGVPMLISPVGTSHEPRRTTYTWSSSKFATKYHLQVASESDLDSVGAFKSENIVIDSTVADTTAKLSAPLEDTTTYYWHVAAIDTGRAGAYSAAASYTTGTGIDAVSKHGGIPKEFTLYQNYPNPFNPTTVINYQLPVNSLVTLKVYDVLGRDVATLVNEQKSAGSYHVTFDAHSLPSGVYFYRLKAGSYSQTRKLLLLK